MNITRAFADPDILSGITEVDLSRHPWPGYTFAPGSSAAADLVDSSYDALAEALRINRSAILTVRQVHGATVVTEKGAGTDADAIITNGRGVLLGVKLADCAGVLLHDPVRHVIAAIHSGWRGTAANITSASVTALRERYGTDPADLRAWISPCASGRVYEVGEDVADVLAAHCRPHGSRWTFDNRAAITEQLRDAGLDHRHIAGHDACTITDPHWHSHRRDRERAGRMLAFIGMFPA
jgi:YfiH family protein